MSVVKGKNVILSVQKGAALYPISCNSVCTLTFQRDMIESTFRDSGQARSFLPGKITTTIDGSGPIEYANQLSPSDVVDYFNAGVLLNWEFELVDDTGHATITKTYSGRGYFNNVTLTGDIQQAAMCDYTIQVSGEISGTATPDQGEITVQSLFYDALGTEVTISNTAWINADMLLVERNGIGLYVITGGSPTGSQVLFNAAAGSLTFPTGLALAAGEYIHTIFES